MAGARRAGRSGGGEITPLRLLMVCGVLLVLVLAALRFVPGSPFGTKAAASWSEGGAAGDRPSAGAEAASRAERPTPAATSAAPSPLEIAPTDVKIDATGWWSWAMQDTRTGEIHGSSNMTRTSTTASLIKAWIGADFLRRSAEQDSTPSDARLAQVSTMIRDSNNEAAQALWQVVGESASITRLISTCGLTDSSAYKDLWSNTNLSARDITRLGACIVSGKAAGPKWTDWLLDEMRQVRGTGDFGIRKAFPAAEQKSIAIKNGWVTRDAVGQWNVNCLAIGDGWTMGVMTVYPASLGYTYGANICKSVAQQLRAAV
ncbi:serine hydrolase [Micromonospora sp. NPDC049559]|uniref:serine hydrolase n=1 Tax=Micromonospora sp. NPDC049559 TaxID=3155923 RepID=UPI00341A741E